MGTTDEDKIVLETSQQTLNNKILAGTVTNGLSSIKVQNADITGTNNLQIPQGNSLVLRHLSSNGNRLYLGTGGAQPLEIADLVTTQTLENKIILSPNISGGTLKGANVGGTANGEPVSIEGTSKVKFVSNTIDTDKLALINGQKEIVSFPTKELGKAYGGTGVDGTNVTFPTTGVIVTEAGSQTLSNKTIGSVTAASGILSIAGTGALKVPAGLGSERPASPVEGMIRYNSETDSFEGYASDTWSGLGGGGTVDRITQATHGFVVGDVLWLNGSTYAKAKADAANTAEVVGMVSRVIDANNFEMTLSGEVSGLTGLTAGEVYFLSAATAGALTVTEPSVVGQVSSPVGVASSTTSLYVAPKRGVVVGGANLRTQIGLNGAALVSQTTNIQNVTAYTAGELSGWVYIDATTDRRFYIQVQFVKDAANAWKCAYQTTGDTPPQGFNVDVIVSGPDAFVQVQMPPVAGFSSANINFALNAPAVGATLPLQIDSASLTNNGIAGVTGAAATAVTASGSAKIGEYRTFTFLAPTMPAFNAIVNAFSANLPAGIWLISGGVGVHGGTSGVVASPDNYIVTSISQTSATENLGNRASATLAPANSGGIRGCTTSAILNLTGASTTIYFTVRHGYSTLGNSFITNDFCQPPYAVRIA